MDRTHCYLVACALIGVVLAFLAVCPTFCYLLWGRTDLSVVESLQGHLGPIVTSTRPFRLEMDSIAPEI